MLYTVYIVYICMYGMMFYTVYDVIYGMYIYVYIYSIPYIFIERESVLHSGRVVQPHNNKPHGRESEFEIQKKESHTRVECYIYMYIYNMYVCVRYDSCWHVDAEHESGPVCNCACPCMICMGACGFFKHVGVCWCVHVFA